MQKAYLFLSVVFMLFSQSTRCQLDVAERFSQHAFQEKEHIAVHFNKDIFTTAETLWFTAYLEAIPSNNLSNASLNLQVGIYDRDGTLINQSVHYINDGVASGSIVLKQPSGTYFLKMQTNWMRNFPGSKPFIKQIHIVDYSSTVELSSEKINITNTARRAIKPSDDIEMIVNTLAPRDLIISFQKLTKMNASEQNFFLAIHNNKKLELTTLRIKGATKVVKIAKDQLMEGIHTILLLDKNQKILQEQVLFHLPLSSKLKPATIALLKRENDSISLGIIVDNTALPASRASISIVPLASKTSEDAQSLKIQSVFKNIWTPENIVLFIPRDRETLAELNERLLFAKNVLDWQYLASQESKPTFEKERGFEITGKIEGWTKDLRGSISFYQRSAGQLETTEVDIDGAFTFKNSYIEKGDELNFTVTKNNKTLSDPVITIHVTPKLWKDSLRIAQDSPIIDTIVIAQPQPERLTQEGGINLGEVELIAKNKKLEFVRNERLVGNAAFRAKKIDIKATKKYPMLSSYIRSLGFKVTTDATDGSLFISSVRIMDPPPVLFIDGFLNNSQIKDQTLAGIDEIYYDSSSSIAGNPGGTIHIYRKTDGFVGSEITAVVGVTTDKGFEKPQTYFSQAISSNYDAFKKNYGTVYWNGNLSFDSDGEAIISFPDYGLDGVKVILQGLDGKGDFFSQEEEVYFE